MSLVNQQRVLLSVLQIWEYDVGPYSQKHQISQCPQWIDKAAETHDAFIAYQNNFKAEIQMLVMLSSRQRSISVLFYKGKNDKTSYCTVVHKILF